jgi:hypothetical protein
VIELKDRHPDLDRRCMQPFKGVPVVCAWLGENSGLVGAAALAVAPDR